MSQCSEQRVSCYKLERTIDRGGFGIVHLASHIVTGQKVAVKVLKKDVLDPESLPKLYSEAQIMQKLKHPHIVQLFEMIERTTRICLIMEYAPLGNLHYYILEHGKMQELQARSVFRQLVSAVQYCHQRGVIHRDLKLENVLLDSQMNSKLTDFGLAEEFTPGTPLSTFCGSPNYIAPEIAIELPYDGPAADVWALGVILYALVTGKQPFDGITLLHLRHVVMAAQYSIPEHVSSDCQLLLRKILLRDATLRASLISVMSDTWLNTGYEGDELKPYTEPPPDQDPAPERTNGGCEDLEPKPANEPLHDVDDPTPEITNAGYAGVVLPPANEPMPDLADPMPFSGGQTLDVDLILAAVFVVVSAALWLYLLF
ncbi:MAP/microtubule affinity-regulating kinase 4-like [Anopheles ziemanni]|uniref:MAP/microtubule affinity-regulating kinase 4-like n=1 Tax=Anopheles coustani TaxID=139045 RepID=UPI00265B1555|nr:MAP/microtubule affinity-regulating kinase 4-like [Anopheles coustani]XP_058175773.1 MAP/microtubule affinity-regulating kinase 4-like [Anopheles ziemanni]